MKKETKIDDIKKLQGGELVNLTIEKNETWITVIKNKKHYWVPKAFEDILLFGRFLND